MSYSAELDLECSQLHMRAHDLSRDEPLRRALTLFGKDLKVYTVKDRVKTADSILSKVERKRRELEKNGLTRVEAELKYGPYSVTDPWGIRFVALFQDHIPPIIRGLLNNLADYNAHYANTIRMKEFVIYTNRTPTDPLSISGEARSIVEASSFGDVAKTAGEIRAPENRKSAYSSVHFVFAKDIEIKDPQTGKRREFEICFEVQIRDIFEEGWGEIQHSLVYSDKDLREDDEHISVEDQDGVAFQLNVLKTLVDGCSQFSTIIRKSREGNSSNAGRTIFDPSVTSRARDRDFVVSALRKRFGFQNIMSVVNQAYDNLHLAEMSVAPDGQYTAYKNASINFKESIYIGEREGFINLTTAENLPIGYYLKMELANCLAYRCLYLDSFVISHDDKADRDGFYDESIRIYKEILQANPRDPIVKWRLAKIISRMELDVSDIRHAIVLIDESLSLINGENLIDKDHWLKVSNLTLKGYYLWKLGEFARQEGISSFFDFLEAAIDVSIGAYEGWAARSDKTSDVNIGSIVAHKAQSNLVYFLASYVKNDGKRAEYGVDLLKRHLDEVYTFDIGRYYESFKTKDTIAIGFDALGDREGARRVACELFNQLRGNAEARFGSPLLGVDDIRKNLVPAEISSFETAIRLGLGS